MRLDQSTTPRDRLATWVICATALLLLAAPLGIIGDVVVRGINGLSFEFLSQVPVDAGRSGGIAPMIVSTVLLLLVTVSVAVPISLGSAYYLTELSSVSSRVSRLVRRSLDTLAAVPSIVFGLFGNALFCIALGWGYSIWSGGMTLACMVLPILIRTTESAFRAVPNEYRQAAAAVGLSRWTWCRRILIPSAAPALGAGLVLGLGRALAETAALLFTAGYVTRMPSSLSDSGRALSVHIYDLSMNVPGGTSRAYTTALVLLGLLLALNAAAIGLTRIAGWGFSQTGAKGTS